MRSWRKLRESLLGSSKPSKGTNLRFGKLLLISYLTVADRPRGSHGPLDRYPPTNLKVLSGTRLRTWPPKKLRAGEKGKITSYLLGPRSREMMANKSLTRDGRSLGARRPRAGPLGNITTFSSIGTSEGPYSLVSRTLCALAGKDDRSTDHTMRHV